MNYYVLTQVTQTYYYQFFFLLVIIASRERDYNYEGRNGNIIQF